MNILLINNRTKYLKKLKRTLKKHQVKIIDFKRINLKDLDEYDLIILSGGHSFSAQNHIKEYVKEIKLIKKIKKPIFGICLGFELIALAFKEKLEKFRRKKGLTSLRQIKKDKIFKGLPKTFKVYENHTWRLTKTKTLITLAKSEDGIEVIKHPKKKIYATQFHPEILKTKGYKILNNFLERI